MKRSRAFLSFLVAMPNFSILIDIIGLTWYINNNLKTETYGQWRFLNMKIYTWELLF